MRCADTNRQPRCSIFLGARFLGVNSFQISVPTLHPYEPHHYDAPT